MKIRQEIIKRIYRLDRVTFHKLEEGGWTVRGCFTLRTEIDDAKRFVFLKRFLPTLSYLRFKSITFLRPITYIEIQASRIYRKDFEKIKSRLWDKLNLFLSHRLEQLILPVQMV